MLQTWQLQDAKNKFSRVVESAVQQGPQIVTKHGIEVAVVLSYAEYRKILVSQKRLVDFFRSSPFVEVDLDLRRDPSDARPTLDL